MSDFDEVLKPENEAQKPATKVDHAERKRPVLKGDPNEKMQQLGFEQVQHPGRFEGGHETVLRPVPKAQSPSGGAMADQYAREEQRAEFLLAAQAARIAKSLVVTYAQTQRDRAHEEGHRGISRAYVHLNMAMHLGDLRQAPRDAALDAYVNCVGLLAALRPLKPSESATNDLSRLVGRLHQETELKIPATPAARDAYAKKHARAEVDAKMTVVTAPLRNASLVLSTCVDDFLTTLIGSERVDRNPNNEKGPKFSAAAKKAAGLVTRALSSCRRPELGIDPEDPVIVHATTEYRGRAQRFLNWAIVETLADDVLTHEAATLIKEASDPLLAWSGAEDLQQPRSSEGSNGEQNGTSHDRLDEAWNKIFRAQRDALNHLAMATSEEYQPPWSAKLFAVIAKAGLAALVGGPAGAAGAIAGTFVTVSEKPTRAEEGRKGGLANAIESLVGAAISETVDRVAAAPEGGDTRKRFFNGQEVALGNAQEVLASTVLAAAKMEAKRSQNPARALQDLTDRIRAADQIAKEQAERAVQDWFSYCARASHGTDQKSGGADMTGIGETSPARLALGNRVPDGVLELEIKLDGRQPRIANARAGSMRKDDVDHLKGIRIRDVRMPIQFRLITPVEGIPATVVVSRNEAGVLWLRAADQAAREHLVKQVGGKDDSDADVLRAASIIVETISDHALTNVGGAE